MGDDRNRIINLLHESILHLCKVSVRNPGPVEVHGLVCITQADVPAIVVQINEKFSNATVTEKKDQKEARSGSKKRSVSDDAPRKKCEESPGGKRMFRSKSCGSGPVVDLTDDIPVVKIEDSPGRRKSMTELTKDPQTSTGISQIRPRGNYGNLPQGHLVRPQNYSRPIAPPIQMNPRQRFIGRGATRPPPLRNMMTQQRMSGQTRASRGRPRMRFPNPACSTSPSTQSTLGTPMPPPPAMSSKSLPNPAKAARGGRSGGKADTASSLSISTNKMLRCKYKACNFSCSNRSLLQTHVLLHLSSSVFSCSVVECNFSTKDKQMLFRHYRTIHNCHNPQFCFKCFKAYRSREEVANHHSECLIKSVQCEHCGESFEGLSNVASHLADIYEKESLTTDRQEGNQSDAVPSSSDGPSLCPMLQLCPDSDVTSEPAGDLELQRTILGTRSSNDVQPDIITMPSPEPQPENNQSCDMLISTCSDSVKTQVTATRIDLSPSVVKDNAQVTLFPLDNLSLLPGAEGLTFDLFPLVLNENLSDKGEGSNE